MRRHIFALTFVAVPLAAAMVGAQSQARATEPRTGARGVEPDALDRKADPCGDFYEFACGGWVAKHPVPADRRSYGRFTEVQDRNFTILRRILEAPRASTDDANDLARAQRYYAACMDEAAIESAQLKPLQADLATIDELLNPDDLPVLLAHLHAIGVRALFRFGAQTDRTDATQEMAVLDQDGLSLPDREYCTKSDEASSALRTKFASGVEKIFTLAGEAPDAAAADAKAVLAIETALASASLDRVARRNPANVQHEMALTALQALTPNTSWRKYAVASEAPKFQVLNVAVPDYIKAIDRLLAATPLGDIKRTCDGSCSTRRPISCPRRTPRPTSTCSAGPSPASRRRRRAGAAASPRSTSGWARRSARRSSTTHSARRPKTTRCGWCRTSKPLCSRTSTPRRG